MNDPFHVDGSLIKEVRTRYAREWIKTLREAPDVATEFVMPNDSARALARLLESLLEEP